VSAIAYHSSIITAGNGGTQPTQAALTIFYNQGTQKYELVQTLQPEWLVLKRGLHRQRLDDDGHLIGDATDEVPMRAMWAHYKSLMEDGR